jgi:hypothetical protein
LDGAFDVERVPAGRVDDVAVAALLADRRAVCLAQFAGEDALWFVRRRPGAPHEALMPDDRGPAWRDLNVAIVGAAVINGLLGIAPEEVPLHVTYAHDIATAREALHVAEVQIAFYVAASSVDELMAVADAGEIMPPKSTYFWPKVPAGLAIHDLT